MDDSYFDHDADIGIIGRGKSLEDCFIDGARAMFAFMSDLSHIEPKHAVKFSFKEEDIELAFVTWLNHLLAESNKLNMIFSRFDIKRDNNTWYGEAAGEKWRDDMERGTDVKGATLTMLSVKQHDSRWEARCVIDV